ncbi:GntR family transcriptional regulator [Brevibacterium aurantiacum]|uniref:GntR family transcriptional regulator n=1 Tax=Brevibacterium aurantiacum TaxID=273384 RepID=A0A556CBZ2_BREAU|nr:GntR family transcriptional regulator [Brevibacterium aurantiacum]
MKLAEELGVSRTPLREALRMLQHEGLARVEANKRVTIADVNPADLDALYALRIQQEALTIFQSTKHASNRQRDEARSNLEAMFTAIRDDNIDEWSSAHRRFHMSMAGGVHERFQTSISRHFDHAERYRHIYLVGSDVNWAQSSQDHSAICEAYVAGQAAWAAELLAEHYARTAKTVIQTIDPEFAPEMVASAVTMALSLRFV